MTNEEALHHARTWVANRKPVRKLLIEMARNANPPPDAPYANALIRWDETTSYGRAVRKLYQFPSDLSEERLLNLIDNGGRS